MEHPTLPHDHHQGATEFLQQLPTLGEFAHGADIFKLLGDPTRLRLFWILCHREECVLNLSAMMGMSSPALSHHLRILKSYDLVNSRREGKEVYYRASEDPRTHALHQSMEAITRLSCPPKGSYSPLHKQEEI